MNSPAHRFGSILTLAAFSIAPRMQSNLISLSDLRVTKALLYKRETDLLGHFGEQSFAFLLPSVDSARRIMVVVSESLLRCLRQDWGYPAHTDASGCGQAHELT
jgi:hypothetical protein